MHYCRKSHLRTAVSKFLTLLSIAAIPLVHSTAFAACGNDNDCKGDRICVNNQCVDPVPNSAPEQPASTVAPAPSPAVDNATTPPPVSQPLTTPVVYEESVSSSETEDDEDNPTVSENTPPLGLWDIWFNPMGFIQFGPTAGFEIRTANNLYVGIHGRYAAMGMLYNSLLESRAQDETNNGSYNGTYHNTTIEVSPQSAGVGAEFKYYLPFTGHANMLYFGMFGEYMSGGYTAFQSPASYSDPANNQDPTKLYIAKHQSIGMGAMVGHRWRFGESRKVLLTAGIITGVARPFLNTKDYIAPKKTIDMPQRNEFIFMAELALGYGM